jgi:hypothetical protein
LATPKVKVKPAQAEESAGSSSSSTEGANETVGRDAPAVEAAEDAQAKVEAAAEANTEILPVNNANERLTQPDQDKFPTDKDVALRSKDVVNTIVNTTGQIPADVEALEAELVDQVNVEAEAERKQGAPLDHTTMDALTLERLDHARTLKQALGLVSDNDAEQNRKLAEERNKVLKDKTRDTSKDNVHNSRPANWIVTKVDADGDVEAYNRITGKEYSGPATELMKQATNVKNDEKKQDAPKGTEA